MPRKRLNLLALPMLVAASALAAQGSHDAPAELPPATAPLSDRAGNRLEALEARASAPEPGSREARLQATARHCSADRRWCAIVERESEEAPWQLAVHHRFQPDSRGYDGRFMRLPLAEPGDDADYAIWPWIVRESGDTALVGLLSTRRTGYSGGGAAETHLALVRIVRDRPSQIVMDVPVEASVMIRACFSERDFRPRRGACHDEYEFWGALRLDPETAEGRSRFLFATTARTYPGRVSRMEDSLERPPLRRRDLVWRRDPICSYRRAFAFDPASGRYRPDAPPPACNDYVDDGWRTPDDIAGE